MTLTFQLPLPDPALSPNARCHWSRKAAAVKTARTAAKVEAKRVLHGAAAPGWGKARWRAVFFLGTGNRQPDPDNAIAQLKAYLDGIADAGVIGNDRDLWPERPVFRRVERMERVEISITPES